VSEEKESGWFPITGEEHELQLASLLAEVQGLGETPRVLDLGAGDGRLAIPLRDAGCEVVAVDNDPRAVDTLRAHEIDAHEQDFLNGPIAPLGAARFDAVICMGNTFCLVHDVDAAVSLVGRIKDLLREGGLFIIDNIVGETWRDIASGNWQEGVSEDGSMQLLWAEGENVVALREGDAVDEASWEITDRDTRMRLWALGGLTLLALAGGLGRPRIVGEGSLILFSG